MAPRKRTVTVMEKIPSVITSRRRLKKDFNKKKRENEISKGWRSIKCPPNHRPPRKNGMPWLMITDFHCRLSSSWKLIDPSSLKTHTINIEGIEPTYIICGSKFGWLLLSRTSSPSHDGSHSTTSFFLYSPFLNERIDLPDLDSMYEVATFSSVPTSPDCIFFVLYYRDLQLHISTCHRGDKAWSTKTFSGEILVIKNVVYSKGVFYCSNLRGRLAAFDVDRQSWNVLSEPKATSDVPIGECYTSFMIEDDNGELLLVLMGYSSRHVFVHKLDRSKMEWVKVENLTDKSLFISPTTSVLVSKNKETKGLMNRIYYCLPYSVPKFYSFKARKSYRSFFDRCGDLCNEDTRKYYFWIEAP